MQQVLARKNVQKTKLEAAEMILDPCNQQICPSNSERSTSKQRLAEQQVQAGGYIGCSVCREL